MKKTPTTKFYLNIKPEYKKKTITPNNKVQDAWFNLNFPAAKWKTRCFQMCDYTFS